MVLAEFIEFKHGLYKSCGIECFEGIVLEPCLLQPCFHVAGICSPGRGLGKPESRQVAHVEGQRIVCMQVCALQSSSLSTRTHRPEAITYQSEVNCLSLTVSHDK